MIKITSIEKNLTKHNWVVALTIVRTLNWLMMPGFLVYGYYKYTGDPEVTLELYLVFLIFGFGFAFPYWRFIRKWSFGVKAQHPVWEILCRCFLFLILPIAYVEARLNIVRCFKIGQIWFNQDPHKYMFKVIERAQKQTELKVQLLEQNRRRDTTKERKRLEKLLNWAQQRKEKFYMKNFIAVARAISWHIREIEDHCHFDEENLTGLFHRYKHAFPSHKQFIKDKYRDRMTPSAYDPKLPDISPKQITLEGKLLYLAVLIRSHRDNHYDRLDFAKSDFATGKYVYSQSRSAIDIAHWKKQLPAINAYLGGEWMVEPLDGTSLKLSQLKELPSVLPFQEEHLKPGEIFYGFNVRTGEPYYNSLEKIPHHLVVGQSGSGKSVFLNQIMASVLYNIEAFEKVYLVDLKGGVELAKYAPLHETLQLVDDYDDLPGIATEIYRTLRSRLKEMRDTGKTIFEGKHILFIVDEYAQINQFEPITREEKENHKKLLSYLNRISQLGRATRITIWAQLQKATIDNISASFRNNLQTKICFKVHSNSDAATVFGNTEDLPGVASIGGFKNLAKGRFILSDDISGEAIYMQSTMMEHKQSLVELMDGHKLIEQVSEEQTIEQTRPSERSERG